jgi:hypothetical protein
MLVPFVIDADSLSPDPVWTPAQSRSCHKDLLDVWQQVGLLVHDSDRFDGSRLNLAVQKLPQGLRALWLEALEHVPLRPAANGWAGSVSQADVAKIHVLAKLALVDDTRAEVEFSMSVNDDEISITPQNGSNLDICRLLTANQAAHFRKALGITGIHIEASDTYEVIWETRFHALAAAPLKLVSIVDRYAMKQHIECPQTKLSGIERFLRLLDRDAAGPRHVTVFSAWTAELHGKSMTQLEQDIRNVLARLPNKNVKRVKLHMVPNEAFGKEAHDRFIRFGRYVWDLGSGMSVFDGPSAAARCAASFKTGTMIRSYEDAERNLANADKAKFVEVI